MGCPIIDTSQHNSSSPSSRNMAEKAGRGADCKSKCPVNLLWDCLLEMTGKFIHNPSTIWLPKKYSTNRQATIKERNLTSPYSQTRNNGELQNSGSRRKILPRNEPPNWLSNIKWSALKTYTPSNTKWTEQLVCVCINMLTITKKKRPLFRERIRGWITLNNMEGVGGRKEKEKWCNHILSFKINSNIILIFTLINTSGNEQHSQSHTHFPL